MSSVEWFYQQLIIHRIIIVDQTSYKGLLKSKLDIILEQVIKMHKEEIENAANNGCCEWKHSCLIDSPLDGQRYYNETFGDNNE